MKVLVACEYSGVVRDAFRDLGHDAWSCDIIDTETPGPHLKGDVRQILSGVAWRSIGAGSDFVVTNIDVEEPWDLMIAHPPCTHLAVSGARWFKGKEKEQAEALEFVKCLWNAPIEKICVENPISILSTHIRKPDQIIQPWMFGHGEKKSTCLWLKNLPKLVPTDVVDGREARIHNMGPSKNRGKERSRTYTGIAEAMATQWGL